MRYLIGEYRIYKPVLQSLPWFEDVELWILVYGICNG